MISAPSGNEATPKVSPRADNSCDVLESNQPEDKEGTDLNFKHFNNARSFLTRSVRDVSLKLQKQSRHFTVSVLDSAEAALLSSE